MDHIHKWLCAFIPEWVVNPVLFVFFGVFYLSVALGLIYGVAVVLNYSPTI